VVVDLGGPVVKTWAYGESVPGPLLRARAGDLMRIKVDNALPATTSVHWHGIALRNDMDGVPGMTQAPIGAGKAFTYEFTVPDPGTYFYHPHSGLQIDRGLYGALLVDEAADPGGYDVEWTVVLGRLGRRHRPHPRPGPQGAHRGRQWRHLGLWRHERHGHG